MEHTVWIKAQNLFGNLHIFSKSSVHAAAKGLSVFATDEITTLACWTTPAGIACVFGYDPVARFPEWIYVFSCFCNDAGEFVA